jgi:hypothetical protein
MSLLDTVRQVLVADASASNAKATAKESWDGLRPHATAIAGLKEAEIRKEIGDLVSKAYQHSPLPAGWEGLLIIWGIFFSLPAIGNAKTGQTVWNRLVSSKKSSDVLKAMLAGANDQNAAWARLTATNTVTGETPAQREVRIATERAVAQLASCQLSLLTTPADQRTPAQQQLVSLVVALAKGV